MAKEKTYQTDIRKARKQQKRKQKIRKIIGVTAVACIVLAVILTSEAWLPKLKGVIKGATDKASTGDAQQVDGNFPIEIGETNSSEMYALGDELVLVTDTNVIVYNKNGEKQVSVQHKLANPVGVTGDDMIMLYDKGGYSLVTINSEGEVYSKQFTEKIILAKLGASDYSAVVTQTDKYAAYLTVYDEKGKEAFLWSSTQRVTDLTLNSTGDGCLISSIKANGGELVSSITALSFSQTEPIFTIDNIPAMVYDTVYSDEGTLWMLSDTRVVHMNSAGEYISQYDFDTTLVASAIDSNTAAVVEKGVVNTSFELTIASSESTDIKKHTIDGTFKQILCYDSQVYVMTDSKMFIYDSTGEKTGEYNISSDYSSFSILDGEIFAKDYRSVYKLELKESE